MVGSRDTSDVQSLLAAPTCLEQPMSGTFLSRWSQRKGAAREAEQFDHTPSNGRAPADERTPATQRAAANDAASDRPPEFLASLPQIEELTADTDITPFLHKAVPKKLRNAALRKVWLLDPAIRNFVGHARDYAYDWNAPGGVPGGEGILDADEVAATVRHLFRTREAPAGARSEKTHLAGHNAEHEERGPAEEQAAPRDPDQTAPPAAPEV